ncbi:MAG: CoA transferase [Deltaproteobacteria bacterium]|nr:CoA transferase [Deltaproteobacteria bacterium]
MKGPLEGIRVVEISMFQQGPVAGMRLGDLGADVIKVEPKTGDPGRRFMRIIGAMVGLKGRNYYFEHCNRNKKKYRFGYENPTRDGSISQTHR